MSDTNRIFKFQKLRKSLLILTLFGSAMGLSLAQDTEPSKNKFGATLSTNIFGWNGDLNNVDVGGGFYFSRKISKRVSIYFEMDGSSRNHGNLTVKPGLSGEFVTGNLATYVGPMVEIARKYNLGMGVVQNHLLRSELKTETATTDISGETRNFSSLYFDFRSQISDRISLGTRYEWGLNSILKATDRKVTKISFNMFIHFGGKKVQEKNN